MTYDKLFATKVACLNANRLDLEHSTPRLFQSRSGLKRSKMVPRVEKLLSYLVAEEEHNVRQAADRESSIDCIRRSMMRSCMKYPSNYTVSRTHIISTD